MASIRFGYVVHETLSLLSLIRARLKDGKYHSSTIQYVYESVYWENVKTVEKVTIEIKINKDSIKIDPYYSVVKAMLGNPLKVATVGHIPKEISKDVYFFLKEEGGKVKGFFFTKYRLSLIPAGRLKIPPILSFKSLQCLPHQKIKVILTQLYSWEFEAKKDDVTEDQNEEAIETIIEKDQEIEVVKTKKKRKPQQVHGLVDETVDKGYSEVIKAKVKRKPLLINDSETDLNKIVEK